MNIHVLLFKDSNCDLCKIQQQELIDNPPAADLEIIHINREHNQLENYYSVDKFPTTIIVNFDTKEELNRFIGFINTECIDINIKQYKTKCGV